MIVKIRGEKFPRLDNVLLGGRLDSYFRIFRISNGVETKVYESEHIDRDVTPVFSKIIIVAGLENSIEKTEELLFRWYDKNDVMDDEYFGSLKVNSGEIATNGPLYKYTIEGEKAGEAILFFESGPYHHEQQ